MTLYEVYTLEKYDEYMNKYKNNVFKEVEISNSNTKSIRIIEKVDKETFHIDNESGGVHLNSVHKMKLTYISKKLTSISFYDLEGNEIGYMYSPSTMEIGIALPTSDVSFYSLTVYMI